VYGYTGTLPYMSKQSGRRMRRVCTGTSVQYEPTVSARQNTALPSARPMKSSATVYGSRVPRTSGNGR
jgi:hypothetical protein